MTRFALRNAAWLVTPLLAAVVLTYGLVGDPQIVARAMRVDLPDASGNAIPSVRMPVMLDGIAACADRPSPGLGEHTEEVLAELEAG